MQKKCYVLFCFLQMILFQIEATILLYNNTTQQLIETWWEILKMQLDVGNEP